jgi:GAF domain-containing protein
MMPDTRERAHRLIDRLPETQLSDLVQFLETIVDPSATALRNAPLDDEAETEEERLAAAEARDWFRKDGGEGIPHVEAMRRLGLE